MGEAPYNDINVRKAIAYAIDKQSLLDNIYEGFGYVSNGMRYPQEEWPPVTWSNRLHPNNRSRRSPPSDAAAPVVSASPAGYGADFRPQNRGN